MNDYKIHDFPYDDFQLTAIESINKGHSVIVSAPTGAGKTVIAEYVCHVSLQEKKGIIYTAPIKALSNQKYRDFTARYGKDMVGILTGDVVIQPEAPILIMTTEIFRNRLFDPEHLFDQKKWVIFDEIHYLDDINRGTVWEESLIFFPKHMKCLALSATIPNIEELASWIESIHHNPVDTVIESKRPVPLSFRFIIGSAFFKDMNRAFKNVYLKKISAPPTTKMETLIDHLKHIKGFPAIYFVFSRKRCEVLAKECNRLTLVTQEERDQILAFYDEQLSLFQLQDDPHADEMRLFVRHGIAFHHAGILPPLKEVIERLFTARLLKLIFTTETFALGINMPAKVVIFDEFRKYYGTNFDYLKTRDFFQMAGRAGRRGFDDEGLIYSIVNPRRIPFKVLTRILYGEPEPVLSQFNSSYATVLNLYQMLGEGMFKIYPLSFHHYQSGKKQKKHGLGVLKNKISLLKFMGYIDEKGLTDRGLFASKIFGYELQATELFMKGFFEEKNEIDICIMITAMIYEPRKGQPAPYLTKEIRALKHIADRTTTEIERSEQFFHMETPTKRFYFHLSQAVKAWMTGASFDELHHYTAAHEGEIIRYFRMTLQILRELKQVQGSSQKYYQKIGKCIELIKRDIIDPETQFELG